MAICVLFTPVMSFVAVAEEGEEEPSNSDAIINEEYMEEANDNANFGEKFVVSIIMAPVNFIIDLFGARDVSFLVFQRPELAPKFGSFSDDDSVYLEVEETEETSDGVTDVRDNLILGVFTDDYFDGIALIYDTIHSLLPIPLVMMLALGGLVLLFDVLNADTRSKFKEYILGAIFVVVLFRFGHLLWEFIFRINYFIVDLVWVTLNDNGIYTGRFLNVIFGTDLDLGMIQSLGTALLALVAFFMTFVLNFQYTMRMISLSVLIFTFPIVTLSLIFPSRREAMNIWIHEFTSNVFIQAAHALALGLFFYLRHTLNGDVSFWVLCVFLFGLPSIVFMVQKIVGAFTGVQGSGGGAMGNFGQALGIASLMNMTRMVQRTRGKNVSSHSSDGTTGSQGDASSNNRSNNALGGNHPNIQSRALNKGSKVPMSDGSHGRYGGVRRGIGNRLDHMRGVMQAAVASEKGQTLIQGGKDVARVGAKVGLVAAGGAASAMATGNAGSGIMAAHMVGGNLFGSGASDGTEDGSMHDGNDRNSSVEDPASLPRSFQVYASQPEDLRDYHKEQGLNVPSKHAETSVKPPHMTDYPTDSESRKRALEQANKGYDRARNHLNALDKNKTNPDVYQNAKISEMQAKNNKDLAKKLADPKSHMSNAASAARVASLATKNYQEAQLALSRMDPNSESYKNQEEVVENAKDIMVQSVGYANQQFPQLQNPELQELIVGYNRALNHNDMDTAKTMAQSINNAQTPKGTMSPQQQTAHQSFNQDVGYNHAATENYEEPNTQSYKTQEKVVENAKGNMEQSISYANTTYPSLQQPEAQEAVQQFQTALNNNDAKATKVSEGQINNTVSSSSVSPANPTIQEQAIPSQGKAINNTKTQSNPVNQSTSQNSMIKEQPLQPQRGSIQGKSTQNTQAVENTPKHQSLNQMRQPKEQQLKPSEDQMIQMKQFKSIRRGRGNV